MVSGRYLFFELSNQTGQGMREQIMDNDMGLSREGLRVTNTAEERESHETKGDKANVAGWVTLYRAVALCVSGLTTITKPLFQTLSPEICCAFSHMARSVSFLEDYPQWAKMCSIVLNPFLVFFSCLEGWKIHFALGLVQNLPPTLWSLDGVLEDSMFWLQASKWDPKGKQL